MPRVISSGFRWAAWGWCSWCAETCRSKMIFLIYGYFEKCISLFSLSPQFKKCMVQAEKRGLSLIYRRWILGTNGEHRIRMRLIIVFPFQSVTTVIKLSRRRGKYCTYNFGKKHGTKRQVRKPKKKREGPITKRF
jgi:hypothetical protein